MANDWQADELLLALHLYCRMPFGKLHKNNPEVMQLADVIRAVSTTSKNKHAALMMQ